MDYTEEELSNKLKENPSDPVYVAHAHELIDSGRTKEALEVCFNALSHDEFNLSGRLALARVFFELGYLPFARRELQKILSETPDSKALKRLLGLLGVSEENQDQEKDVAEVELDIDALEELKG